MASGETLCVFTALHGEPPASNPATLNTRNAVPVLEFDDTTDEEIVFSGFIPRHASASPDVTVTIGWMAADTTVTPHNVVWQIAFMSVTNDADDLDSKAFASFQTFGADQEASASGEVAYDELAVSNANADSIAANEYFRLKIRRDADDTSGTDNLTGEAQLVFVEIRET
jgi:hypothetical protein